jgi:hypothetical protein
LERTLFTLEWLQNPELRRRVQVGLNKGEAKNALAVPYSLTASVNYAIGHLKISATGPAA